MISTDTTERGLERLICTVLPARDEGQELIEETDVGADGGDNAELLDAAAG